eukprot:scaffold41559_cov36-Phaeocystis_antarctica.AAC.1
MFRGPAASHLHGLQDHVLAEVDGLLQVGNAVILEWVEWVEQSSTHGSRATCRNREAVTQQVGVAHDGPIILELPRRIHGTEGGIKLGSGGEQNRRFWVHVAVNSVQCAIEVVLEVVHHVLVGGRQVAGAHLAHHTRLGTQLVFDRARLARVEVTQLLVLVGIMVLLKHRNVVEARAHQEERREQTGWACAHNGDTCRLIRW